MVHPTKLREPPKSLNRQIVQLHTKKKDNIRLPKYIFVFYLFNMYNYFLIKESLLRILRKSWAVPQTMHQTFDFLY